ncbi:MAG: hypothetical protein ACE5PO_03740 [Candidatus Bathyarchaeia archaeon]
MKRHGAHAGDGPRLAVSTLNPDVFYAVTRLLRSRNISFITLKPGDVIPLYVTAVISTPEEVQLIHHARVIVCSLGSEEDAVEEALRVSRNIKQYKSLIMGVDPGETLGLAVIGDGYLLHTASYAGVDELAAEIRRWRVSSPDANITVKIGGRSVKNNASNVTETIGQRLSRQLAGSVKLLLVDEQFTTAAAKRRRVKRRKLDEASALEIALR